MEQKPEFLVYEEVLLEKKRYIKLFEMQLWFDIIMLYIAHLHTPYTI